jgi:hypothetical protein
MINRLAALMLGAVGGAADSIKLSILKSSIYQG